MTVDDIEVLLKETEHNGYPVVVSRESQYLVGFVLRRDLNLALGNLRFIDSLIQVFHIIHSPCNNVSANARRTVEGISGQSLIIFSGSLSPVAGQGSSSSPFPKVTLHKILDMAPITVTDQTPMETVVDMFRKLGLRQTLVTHNG